MLSGQQIAQIQEALLSGFRSRDELAMMVQLELNENLAAIAGGENLRVVVFKLVMWAESEGRTRDVIRGAQNQKGGNPEIQQLAPMQPHGVSRRGLIDSRIVHCPACVGAQTGHD